MTRRLLLVIPGLMVAGAAITGLPAPAHGAPLPRHTLTGGSAQATCDGNTVVVDWLFGSNNAGSHVIVSYLFDRPVFDAHATTTTIMAETHETPGYHTLKATATFEDGYVSSYTASLTVHDGDCQGPATTVAPAPTTQAPQITVPSEPAVPPLGPPATDPTPTTTVPATVESTIENAPTSSVSPPATSSRSRQTAPVSTQAPSTNLPATGIGDWLWPALWVAAGLIVIGLCLLIATHVDRGKDEES